MKNYAVYICGDTDCPHDPAFEHRRLFGLECVPKDFSERTGKSETRSQHRVARPDRPLGYRYEWNGGCDAARAALGETP